MAFNSKVERVAVDMAQILSERYKYDHLDFFDLITLKSTPKSKKQHLEIDKEIEESKKQLESSKIIPLFVDRDSSLYAYLKNSLGGGCRDIRPGTQLFIFRDALYSVCGPCTREEAKVLVANMADQERQQYERLSHKYDGSEIKQTLNQRDRISERVRIAVWRRDEGKCVNCGGRKRLEYDHIIPVVEGGGNTVRNIELLCEDCNRQKGKKIQ